MNIYLLNVVVFVVCVVLCLCWLLEYIFTTKRSFDLLIPPLIAFLAAYTNFHFVVIWIHKICS
jgi:hypothetical protein